MSPYGTPFWKRKKKQGGWLKRRRGTPKQIGQAFYAGPSYEQKKKWPHQTAEWKQALKNLRKTVSKVKREVSPELTEQQLAEEMIEMAEKGDVSAENWLYEHEYEPVEEVVKEPEQGEEEVGEQ